MPRGLDTAAATVAVLVLLAAGAFVDEAWLMPVALLVALAGGGAMELLLRRTPAEGPTPLADRTTFYPLPALIGVACLGLLRQPLLEQAFIPVVLVRVVFLAVAAGLLYYCYSAQRDSFALRPPPTSAARFVLLTLVIVAAFVLFGALYGTRERTLITGTAVGVITFALALELYRTEAAETARTWLLAAATGLVLAQSTWALNYVNLDAVRGGAVLILIFYVLSGLVQYAGAGALTRRVAIEYGGIGVVGLVFVLIAQPA